uniref:Putative serine/threonine protein kinase n=1 Tax=Trypanosoma congolense (strain IL3000) TaxID=1068625 RepID=G0UKL9_TRYCI|nr:putative serine/threonine protein kinase [Trypanosoma congolense IL3000]
MDRKNFVDCNTAACAAAPPRSSVVRVLSATLLAYYLFMSVYLAGTVMVVLSDYTVVSECLTERAGLMEKGEVVMAVQRLGTFITTLTHACFLAHLAASLIGIKYVKSVFTCLDLDAKKLLRVANMPPNTKNRDPVKNETKNAMKQTFNKESCGLLFSQGSESPVWSAMLVVEHFRGIFPGSAFFEQLDAETRQWQSGRRVTSPISKMARGSSSEGRASGFTVKRVETRGNNASPYWNVALGVPVVRVTSGRRITIAVISLPNLSHHIEQDVDHYLNLSRRFHFILKPIIDCCSGTITNTTPNKVVVVWNAFSDNSNHERDGVKFACDALIGLRGLSYDFCNPAHGTRTPTIVAVSGTAVAGRIILNNAGVEILSVHGSCIELGEEISSLLHSIGVRCACIGTLARHCPNIFSCIPRDIVKGTDNKRHVVYEIMGNSPVPPRVHMEVFQLFYQGNYGVAHRLYAQMYAKNPDDWNCLRMSELCYYLEESRKVYRHSFPQWQIFNTELKVCDAIGAGENHKTYMWMKHEASPVEDHIRHAIQRRANKSFTQLPFGGGEQSLSHSLDLSKTDLHSSDCRGRRGKKLGPTEFRDRQGLVFRVSDRVLGTGGCGTAFLGLSPTGALVAIKQIELPLKARTKHPSLSSVHHRRLQRKGIHLEAAMGKALDNIINEVSLLSQLRHVNIVGYISSAVLSDKLLIVMELGSGGSLYDLMKKYGKLKESRAKRYLRDVLQGLEYLHRKNIVHRDIKPQNVLLLETGLCKLTDFGTSQNLQKISVSGAPEGTPPYTAPEAARGKAEKASDIWSFGIMLAHVLSGALPWPDVAQMSPHAFFYSVGHIEDFVPQVDDRMSEEAKAITMRCCCRDPQKRPQAGELLRDPFFKEC